MNCKLYMLQNDRVSRVREDETLYNEVSCLRLGQGRAVPYSEVPCQGGGPCMVSNTSWVMITWDLVVDRQTNMIEEITLTQLD